MRKLWKLTAMAAACMAVVACMTSCFNDDDDNNNTTSTRELTKAEQEAVMECLEGSHQAYLYFRNKETQKTDSAVINITATASDSVFTVSDFPVEILANYISNENAVAQLKQFGRQPISFTYATPYAVDEQEYLKGYYNYYLLVDKAHTVSTEITGEDGEKSTIEATLQFKNYVLSTDYYGRTIAYYQMCQLYRPARTLTGGLILTTAEVNGVNYNISSIFTLAPVKN
ncbi:MAG: DUF4840 domain-containing protein [Prevotella sp.]|nr:DUF4840 domain-containing protein [Prevotella sp.]